VSGHHAARTSLSNGPTRQCSCEPLEHPDGKIEAAGANRLEHGAHHLADGGGLRSLEASARIEAARLGFARIAALESRGIELHSVQFRAVAAWRGVLQTLEGAPNTRVELN
jgi:hypothetical protein